MKKPSTSEIPTKPIRLLRISVAVRRWLFEPSLSIVEPERRQPARLLMTILFVLSTLGLLAFLSSLLGAYATPGESETVASGYRWITFGAFVLLAVEYGLSRTAHYTLAAMLAVGTVFGASFVTVGLDPGNKQILGFLVVGGLVASLFLSARSTAIVFAATILGVLLLPAIVPGVSTLKNLNALFFILTVGWLVVMASSLRERYLEQIEWQTQQLVESEARLLELAIRDPLTGLFNRRYLEEVLAAEMSRAVRKPYPIGVIMADIDHFKRFNDAHGHAAGDAVLVEVAQILRTHIRASDVACRYGGEEFVLVLPEAPRHITLKRAEQIRADLGRLRVQFEGRTLDAISLSLGVAVFPDHGSTIDALLGAADFAMYRAKRNGRDCVVAAE